MSAMTLANWDGVAMSDDVLQQAGPPRPFSQVRGHVVEEAYHKCCSL